MKNTFPKMPTPKFRHPHFGEVMTPKWQRQRYESLLYFAQISRQIPPSFFPASRFFHW